MPEAGRVRWWQSAWATGVAGLVIGASAVGGVWAAQAGPADPGSFTLQGHMTLTGDHIPAGEEGEGCTGYSGFSDIAEGASVTVYDPAGKVLATGALGAGKPDEDSGPCRFPVRVASVPKGSKFYQVEVTHRGKVTITAAEAEHGKYGASLG